MLKFLIIGGLVAAVIGISFGYAELTPHQRTLTVESKLIDFSAGEYGESHYVVRGTDGQIIELQRAWYMFGDNIDELYFQTTEGKTITYDCFGWQIPEFYWYSMCHKIIDMEEEKTIES